MPEPFSRAARIVGERLRSIRLDLGLSQEEVAHLAELHPTNYGKLERGRANPAMSTLVRVATALDIDASTLISGLTARDLPGRPPEFTAADLLRGRDKR